MSESTPVERFLGTVEPAHGPFGLLGLRPADYDAELIREALRQRLTQLSRHRQAASTEADEVRLALHVAAAQLSDPQVRRAILERLGFADAPTPAPRPGEDRAPSPAGPTGNGAAGPPPATRPRTGIPMADLAPGDFKDVALRVLAHSGGWNEFAKRRLGGLAHAYGLDMRDLRRVLEAVAHDRGRPTPAGAPRREREHRAGAAPPPGFAAPVSGRGRPTLLISTALLLLATLVMGVRLLSIVGGEPGAPPERTVQVALPDDRQDAPQPDPSPEEQRVEKATSLEISTGRDDSADAQRPADTLDEIRAAIDALPRAPREATRVFLRTLDVVGETWIDIDAPTLQALRVELASFLQVAIRTDRAAAIAAADAIASPASPIIDDGPVVDSGIMARATFSAGLMARLNRQDLISSIGSRFRGILARLSHDGSGARARDFWPGVALGLEGIAERYIAAAADPEARTRLARGWSAWLDVLERLRAEAPDVGDQLLLATIERAIIEGPDPAMNQAAHDAIGRLVAQLDFVSSESRASERLISWFDDPRISTTALSLVTSRIVFASLIPGFGPEMMLRPDDSEAAREELRDDYALKLGLPVSSEDRAVADLWRARAREAIDARQPSTDPVSALERAALLAKLNESATQRWAGEDGPALQTARDARIERILDEAQAMVEAMAGAPVDIERMTAPSSPPDGAWACRYLEAMRNAGIRQELLNELRNSDHGPRGPVDADVLAEAACYGVPLPLRRSAQSVAERFRDNAYLINGLLEAVSNAARTPDVSTMIMSVTGRALPSTSDPAWRAAARRDLLERLAEMLGRQKLARVEALELAIRETYEDRVAASGAMVAASPADDGPAGISVAGATVAELAGALRDEMASHARRFSEGQWTLTPLHELERRHAARAGLARGRLQEFAAAQLGLAEAIAYVVAAERTSQATDVGAILDRLELHRREAGHVFRQIEAAEDAMLRLWLIRLGEEQTL